MKREGLITFFIHSHLWALSFLLDHLKMLCLKNVLCGGCKFENILQNAFVASNFVMILVSIRMHTKCWLLKIFHESVGVFERCLF